MSLAQDPRAMAELELGTPPGPDGQVRTAPQPPRRRRGGNGLVRGLFGNAKAASGLVILVLFALMAVFAPVLAPGDPTLIQGIGSQPPSPEHWLGTTAKGQDVLALNIWGSRSSLFVGFTVGILATFVGLLVGLASAYLGRTIDNVLSLVTNVFLLLPGLPLLVILAAFLPQGLGTVILVLVITGWAGSARVLGAQAGLEFLGLGDISTVSWGTNLYWASNDGALLTGAWWVFVPPGVCIALVAFALALVNYGVDETTNPRLRRPRRRTTPDEPTRVAASATTSARVAVSQKEQTR